MIILLPKLKRHAQITFFLILLIEFVYFLIYVHFNFIYVCIIVNLMTYSFLHRCCQVFFILELIARFLANHLMDVVGIVYLQYWLQDDCEETFSKHMVIVIN